MSVYLELSALGDEITEDPITPSDLPKMAKVDKTPRDVLNSGDVIQTRS